MGESITSGVAYFRMSTDRQEASIPEQRAWAERAAAIHRVQVVADFADEGISGSEMARRDGLQSLIRFVESRQADPIQSVVCWSIDRFSRSDTLETFETLSRLRRAGVRSILTNSKVYNLHDKIDRTLLAVEQDFTSSGYVRKLSESTTRALLSRAKEAKWLGRVPYGYKIGEDGRLALGDQDRVDAVRWVFDTYISTSSSLRDIARKLAARGVPAPSKIGWNRYAVYVILRNEVYLGHYRWNAERSGRHYCVRGGDVREVEQAGGLTKNTRRYVRSSKEDCIIVPDAHPSLVSRATFDAAAKRLAGNRGRRTTPTSDHIWPLSGLVYCGNCGARMVGQTMYGKKVLYCARASKYGRDACHINRVGHDDVLTRVATQVQGELTPGRLADLRRRAERIIGSASAEAGKDLDRIRAKLADLDRRIDRGAENILLCAVAVRDHLTAKLQSWQEERERIARDLLTTQSSSEHHQERAARAAKAVEMVAKLGMMVHVGNIEGVRDTLNMIVKSVTLKFSYGKKLKNGGQRTSLAGVDVQLIPDVQYLLNGTAPNPQVSIILSRTFTSDGAIISSDSNAILCGGC